MSQERPRLGNIQRLRHRKKRLAGQQQWVGLYNDFDHPDAQLSAMTIDASGNVYVTGPSGTNSIPYVCTTIKYNSTGQEQWVARYNAPNGASGAANRGGQFRQYVCRGGRNQSIQYRVLRHDQIECSRRPTVGRGIPRWRRR